MMNWDFADPFAGRPPADSVLPFDLQRLPPTQILALARLRRAVAEGRRSEWPATADEAKLGFLKFMHDGGMIGGAQDGAGA